MYLSQSKIQTMAYVSKLQTPGGRFWKGIDRKILLKTKPLKNFTTGYKSNVGRNNKGHITSWHKGGGHKASYREQNPVKKGLGLVIGKEYCPKITGFLDRIFFPDFEVSNAESFEASQNSYVLGSNATKPGSFLYSPGFTEKSIGSFKSLTKIPIGFSVHHLSSDWTKRPQYLKSAGAFGILMQKTKQIARIKLRSGTQRNFPILSMASIGSVSNGDHRLQVLGKAGRNRYLGRRPITRGVAMNPVDHPHGGGEGKTSGGRPSVSPWGKPTKGQPTANKKKNKKL